MKTLKMKSLKSALFPIILFLGIGICLACAAAPSIMNMFRTPIPFDQVDLSGDIEGLYVEGTLYFSYDWYCEETEDGKAVAREYVIDADGYYYIGVRAEGKSDMADADALAAASIAYMNGEDDGTLVTQAQYEFKGVIKPMPSDSLRYYHEYVGYDELDTISQDMFLPYYIEISSLGNYSSGQTIGMIVGIAVFFFLAALSLIMALTGHHQKVVKKYIANSSNPEMTRERVEHFIASTPEVNGLRYNRDFICGQQGSTTAFGEMSKLVWVYLHTVEHKRYFITISKTHSLMLAFADGSRQSVSMKNETIAREHIQNLSALCPQTIFGYSDDLNKMFRKDFKGFLDLRYNKVQPDDTAFGNFENM